MRGAGAADVPRRNKTEEARERRIVPGCGGLLQQAQPPVCSWLVAEGVLDEIHTRYLILAPAPGSRCAFVLCFLSFDWFFQQNTRGLLAATSAALFLLFRYFTRVFLRQSECARAAWWLYYVKEAVQPTT